MTTPADSPPFVNALFDLFAYENWWQATEPARDEDPDEAGGALPPGLLTDLRCLRDKYGEQLKNLAVQDRLALDASGRSFDADGRLHVAANSITRAAVNGYRGNEIPRWQELGLDPGKIYQLLRDPAELEKAVPTFNNAPLLSRHPTAQEGVLTIDNPMPHLVSGSLGTDAAWQAPFICNSLVIYDPVALAGIATDEQRELSASYRYDADMTPGVFQGARYDGVMRNIRCNHVALVEKGRAGSDVVVGDAALQSEEPSPMAKQLSRTALFASGALRAYLAPKLAQDAKLDLNAIVAGVTAKTWKADKPKIKLAMDKALPKGSPLLAKDADIEDVVEMLDKLEEVTDEADKIPAAPTTTDADSLSEEEEAQYQALLKRRKPEAAADETDEEKKAREEREKNMVTKPAMDAAIAAAVTKARTDAEAATITSMRAIQEAERAVRPFIGEVVIAQDSAEAVYRLALDMSDVDVTGVPPAAYAAMVKMLPAPGASPGTPRVATDAAANADFYKRFPGVTALKIR